MARRLALGLVPLVIALSAIPSQAAPAAAGPAPSAAPRCSAPLPPPLPPPSDFVDQITNPYYPQVPGTTYLYLGAEDGQVVKDTVVVTHMTKTILGVKTTVVFDRVMVGGVPSETTFDWYAQDKQGTVWYFGEDVFAYVGGHWILSDESWEAGVDGARAGIIMEARPQAGDTYRQELSLGHSEDIAHVVTTDETVHVPYGTFHHALKTTECTRLEPGVVDVKDYGLGVGIVLESTVLGGSSILELVSVTSD